MTTTASHLASYLLARGLIDPRAIVDGDLMIADCSRRNRDFKVIHGKKPGLFVKQAQPGDRPAATLLEREATCYRLAGKDGGFAALGSLLPRFCDYDPERPSLVVELVQDAEDLSEYHQRTGELPPFVARQLGKALAVCHEGIPFRLVERWTDLFPGNVAWILTAHRSPREQFASFGPAALAVLDLARQHPEIPSALDALAAGWQKSCLIHGDVKWDNCLVYRAENGSREVRLIDWETADVGDPLWDAGAVFQAYLTYGALSMPPGEHPPVGRPAAESSRSLAAVRPAMAAFWEAYRTTREPAVGDAQLELALRYGAARMIQTAFEHAAFLPQARAVSRYLLKLSHKFLSRPREAVDELVGR